MILYHGTNCSIDKIDLDKCRPYKDFFILPLYESRLRKWHTVWHVSMVASRR